jgi:hypothetical protein
LNNTVILQGGLFITIKDGWNAMNFPKLVCNCKLFNVVVFASFSCLQEFNHYFTPGDSKTPFTVTGYNKTISTLEEWQKEGFDKVIS